MKRLDEKCCFFFNLVQATLVQLYLHSTGLMSVAEYKSSTCVYRLGEYSWVLGLDCVCGSSVSPAFRLDITSIIFSTEDRHLQVFFICLYDFMYDDDNNYKNVKLLIIRIIAIVIVIMIVLDVI